MSKYKERLDELEAQLTAGVSAIKTSDEWKKALRVASKFHTYSFSNTMLIYLQHSIAHQEGLVPEPLPSRVAGYRKWQELGRQVDKGQKSYQILAPVMGRFASKTPEDASTLRRLKFKERANPDEQVVTRIVGVRPANVFEITQTSGEPLPELPMPVLLKGHAPTGAWDLVAGQVKDEGYTIRFTDESVLRGANGMVVFDTREVFILESNSAAQQLKTLAHELGHIKLHAPEHFDSDSRPRGAIEMEAESFAFMVCDRLGMDTSDYTFGYVAGWSSDVHKLFGKQLSEDLDEQQLDAAHLKLVGERIRKAAVSVLEVIEQHYNPQAPAPEPAIAPSQVPQHVQASHTQPQSPAASPYMALGD